MKIINDTAVTTIIEVPEAIRESIVKQPSLADVTVTGAMRDESTCTDYSDSTVTTKLREVRFQEEYNAVYQGTVLSNEEFDALWYSDEEITQFYENCLSKAGTIQASAWLSNDSQFWSKGLLLDYHLFCTSNEAELDGILGSAAAFHSAATTGLELWCIPSVDRDIQHRIQQMKQQIFVLQSADTLKDNHQRRSEFIRRAACTWSRPARLLAQHTAQAAVTKGL